jgi:ribonucleoside-diphosphate reductase alpha chain
VALVDAPPATGPAPQETTAFGVQSPASAGQSPSVLESPKPEVKPTETDTPTATAVAAESIEAPEAPISELAVIATNGHANGNAHAPAANGNGKAVGNGNGGGSSTFTLNLGGAKVSFQTQADAPSCADCGSIMIRNGSCYKCLNCGSTSGCS